jgi:hypothetical protein
MSQMSKFERRFCASMMSGGDFTLVLEVRGDKGLLLHSRVKSDEFERPKGVKKKN